VKVERGPNDAKRRSGFRVPDPVLWLGLPALAVTFVVLRNPGPSSPVAFAASQVVFLLAAWLSVAGSVMALRTAEGTVERRPWATFAFACVAIAAGETYFSGYQVFIDPLGPAGISASDVLYGIGALALALGLLLVSTLSRMPRVVLARRAADALGLVAVALAAAYAAMRIIVDRPVGTLLDELAEVAYVVMGLAILATVVFGLAGVRGRRPDTWEIVIGAALTLFGLSVMLVPIGGHFPAFASAPWERVALPISFMCSYYLVFVAGVYRSRGPGVSAAARALVAEEVLAGLRWRDVVISTVLLLAIPALGITAFRASVDAQHATVNFIAMALVGSAMVAHTALDAVYTGRLRRRAGTDPLTGLLDARAVQRRLSGAVTDFARYGDPVSVIVADLNDFARVNTLYGRDEGDRLMREVARVLEADPRPRTTPGRLGSDEFVVVLEGADRAEALLAADRIRAEVHGILTTAGLPLTASWGVATCPQDATSPRSLIMKAYSAQHWAKTRGHNLLASYDPARMRTLDQVARMDAAEEQADLAMLLSIVMASESRHEITRFHSRNVAALSVLVAELLGLAAEEVRDAELAGLLHDIGKIGVSDEVLMKAESLSRVEDAHFREHVVTGERLVAATVLSRVAPAIRAHHERWDGTGYPDRLVGDAIPRLARIIAVCDAFEGLLSGRPGRRPLSLDATLQELDQSMGVGHDPEVVEALISIAESLPGMRREDEGRGALWTG